MFRIFSRFNALFIRPHICGAIREYQTQLIRRVKDYIEAFHDKFKVQYPGSKACRVSHIWDLPPPSGSIIWDRCYLTMTQAYNLVLEVHLLDLPEPVKQNPSRLSATN